MGQLDKTQNIIKLFCHMAGKSEIPKEYFLWSVIGLIGASVQDRVGIKKFVDLLPPNLFIFLIGPPGSGKDTAINLALSLVKDNPRMNFLKGRTTAQYIIDRIGTRDEHDEVKGAKLWLISPELSFNIGRGDNADTVVKFMTAIYSGDDIPLEEGTRTNQGTRLHGCNVNWLAGTTIDWLKHCITADAVEGGFFARVVAVKGYYSFAKKDRFVRPLLPADRNEVYEHLKERFKRLSKVEGPFEMTDEAKEIEERWYMERDEPVNDLMVPWWKRQQDLVLKLSMIFSLAEDENLVVNASHLQAGIKLSQEVMVDMPAIMRYASASGDTKDIQTVMDAIRRSGQINHSRLLRAVSSRGIRADKLRHILATLQQSGLLKVFKNAATGALVYESTGEEG